MATNAQAAAAPEVPPESRISPSLLDDMLGAASSRVLRRGTRMAAEARVGAFLPDGDEVTTEVRDAEGDWLVCLWPDDGDVAHDCDCPARIDPCPHVVAAALVLRQALTAPATARDGNGSANDVEQAPRDPRAALLAGAGGDPAAAREAALEERRTAARRERLTVSVAAPPVLEVASPSGFAYCVTLRGDARGKTPPEDSPHGCACPDFEANRLHDCKHVERVRRWLAAPRSRLPKAHARAAERPRVYLHFGDDVEPRLLGTPSGRGSRAIRAAFDADGRPARSLGASEREIHASLKRFGEHVEPQALEWLAERARARPELPDGPFERLLPDLAMTPYDYQREGAAFLAHAGRALLADEMGLGKTVQAILAAVALRRAKRPVERVTIICPASLRGGWAEEIRRWIGEDATLVEGRSDRRAETIARGAPWLVTHYEQVLRDHEHHRDNPPDLLILDEAQRVKGLWARTARVVKSIPAPHVFALTGTPLENRLEEAYAISQLVDQRLLPPLWQLDRDHFVRGDDRRVDAYRGLDVLRERLKPAFLRRRKEDVALQLPERLRSVSLLPLHPAVRETYEETMGHVARIAARAVILPADLERMQKLLVIARRCCNGPQVLGLECDERRVPKMRELEGALSDLCLREGRKVVVFSEWTDMTSRVEALCRRLGIAPFHLHGGVPVRKRPALIDAFTHHDGPAVFISTDAGGVGLNLQAADAVVNVDVPWNPARLEQRLARVHRIGSTRAVQVLLLVTRDTVEERILHLHDTKRAVLDAVWAKDGADVVAAPGGSGAFKEVVATLLAAQAPDGATRDENPPERATSPGLAETRPRRSAAGTTQAARAAAPPPPTPAAPVAVDPALVAQAMGAVAKEIPEEHRQSLSAVFRALADALER